MSDVPFLRKSRGLCLMIDPCQMNSKCVYFSSRLYEGSRIISKRQPRSMYEKKAASFTRYCFPGAQINSFYSNRPRLTKYIFCCIALNLAREKEKKKKPSLQHKSCLKSLKLRKKKGKTIFPDALGTVLLL